MREVTPTGDWDKLEKLVPNNKSIGRDVLLLNNFDGITVETQILTTTLPQHHLIVVSFGEGTHNLPTAMYQICARLHCYRYILISISMKTLYV
jgi:hypothetical protein